MIKQVLKYQGNAKYICILCTNEKNELFIFYALTGKLSIETQSEEIEYETISCNRITFSYLNNYEIKIPIIATKKSHIYHLIKIDDEKEYDHICSVVESLV